MADLGKDYTSENMRPEEGTAVSKSFRLPRILWIAFGVLAVFLCGAALLFDHYYSKLDVSERSGDEIELEATGDEDWRDGISAEDLSEYDEILRQNLEAGMDSAFNNAEVTNILLIGVDNDYLPGMDARGNADGLVILSINKTTKKVVLTSLMRDIYVSVPERYNTKITLVYHYSGINTLIKTVEANFGVPIDNYVLVNYLNVIDIVDSVGGLTMDVTEDELYWMQDKIRSLNYLAGNPSEQNMISTKKAGTLLLNGIQTAAYMRIRYAGNGDFDRTGRARDVLLALRDKAADMSLIELNKLADTVLPCIKTDLTEGQVLSLLFNAPAYMKYATESNRIPIDDTYSFANIKGSMVVINFEKNRKFIYESIYGEG